MECINFPTMNNIHFDYKYNKILKEMEYIRYSMILVKWHKTTELGTKADFTRATKEECVFRVEELIKILNEI